MDLSKLDIKEAADQGAEMVLRHPNTDEILYTDDKPIVFELLGADSTEYRRRLRMAGNKNISKGRKGQTVEKLEAETVDLLAACTVNWTGVVLDGETLEFSFQAAKQLYGDERFRWIYDQVDEFIGERSNFLSNV